MTCGAGLTCGGRVDERGSTSGQGHLRLRRRARLLVRQVVYRGHNGAPVDDCARNGVEAIRHEPRDVARGHRAAGVTAGDDAQKESGEARVGAQHVCGCMCLLSRGPTSDFSACPQFNSAGRLSPRGREGGEGSGRHNFLSLEKHPFRGRPLLNLPESFERLPLEVHGVWSARF